jgi:molybdate transport system permease protein
VRSLQRATGVPSVIVTHDPEEAAMLADEIVVIADGALLQAGTVREVFDRPASPRVAGLLGVENIFPGIAGGGGSVTTCGVTVETGSHHPPGRAVTWAVRATDGVIGERGTPARVLDVIDRGSVTDALVELAPGVVLQLRCGSAAVKAGQQVAVDLPQEAVLVWAESSAGEGS